ncbi:MAG: NACHT domain-containing protein [Thermoanaerobaculia bacterium]|nr:NACHT domain-containing protein [Thermoanaerobaculia bacterium]
MSERSIGDPPATSGARQEASATAVRSTGSAELYERRRARKASPKKAAKPVPAPDWEKIVDRFFQDVEPKVRDRALPPAVVHNRQARAQRRIFDALSSRGTAALTAPIRREVEALVERWAEEGFRDGYSEVEAFEIRCAEEQERLAALQKGDQAGAQEVELQAYRRRVIDQHGAIEIRGLQLSERVLQPLAVAYVPLFLEDRSIEKVVSRTKDFEVRELPRRPVQEALEAHGRLLIVGDPGSGKTTLVSFLATQSAAGERLPFVVPVRSLPAATIDVRTIAAVCSAEVALVENALEEGRALILVDGLDEISPAEFPALRKSIERFAEVHPKAQILVTSRPAGVDEEEPFAGFAPTRLLPMQRSEVDDFIDKWCLAAEISIVKGRALAEEKARLAAEDLKKRLQASWAVEKLAQTPLLATILCVVHRFLGQRIPERRTALYEACTNILLYEWDRAKFPEDATIGQLDAAQKKALLGDLAAAMHERRVAEIAAEDVAERFAERLPALGRVSGEARAILEEIRDRSGILVERRPGFFAFSHLTFQEYLTAVEYVRRGDYAVLIGHRDDRWWHEVIVLAAGQPGGGAAGLVRGLLDADGAEIGSGAVLAAECTDIAIDVPYSLRLEVEARMAKLPSPRDEKGVGRWLKLGTGPGYALLRRFEQEDGTAKAWIAATLRRLRSEEACGFLARQLRDSSGTVDKFVFDITGSHTVIFRPNASLDRILAFLLLDWAIESELMMVSLGSIVAAGPACIGLNIGPGKPRPSPSMPASHSAY